MKTLSRVVLALLVLLLLASAYLGITGGLDLVREAHRPLEILATGTELLYGVAAVAGLVALGTRARKAMAILVVWAVALTATAALASVVWGHTSVAVGVASGAGVGAVVAVVLWGWRRTGGEA